MTERADQDPFSTPAMLRQLAAGYLAGADPKTPLASPLFASLSGLPPLLIQVGTVRWVVVVMLSSWLPHPAAGRGDEGWSYRRAGAHWASVRSGLPFSTTSVARTAALPLPTFLTAWTAPAGTVKASPAWNVLVGWPST